MICRNCLRTFSYLRLSQTTPKHPRRFLTTTPTRPISSTQLYSSTSPNPPPAATSTPSSSQPFSAPLTPSPSPDLKSQASDAAKKKTAHLVKSSIAAGTPLKGLNFIKNQTDPVALPDDEYPAWLWTLLQRQEGSTGDAGGGGDLFSKSKKQRRVAAKRLRKEQAANPGMLEPKIPITEQTIDLPVGDGSLEAAVRAGQARDELTKAMREKRRAGIKEKNFLKAMG